MEWRKAKWWVVVSLASAENTADMCMQGKHSSSRSTSMHLTKRLRHSMLVNHSQATRMCGLLIADSSIRCTPMKTLRLEQPGRFPDTDDSGRKSCPVTL